MPGTEEKIKTRHRIKYLASLIEHAADDGDQDAASRFAEACSDEMVHRDVHKAVVIKLNRESYGREMSKIIAIDLGMSNNLVAVVGSASRSSAQ